MEVARSTLCATALVRLRARLKTERETGECSRLTRAQRPIQAWGSRAWEKKTDCFAVYHFNDRRMTSSFLMVCRAPSISFILQKRWVISWAPRKQFRVKTHWKSLRWIPCACKVLSSCTICSITALFVNAAKRTDNRLVTQRFFSPWRSLRDETKNSYSRQGDKPHKL